MIIQDNFSVNTEDNLTLLFQQARVPVFQNKVYPTEQQARLAETGDVQLVQSKVSGFVFNKAFTSHVMNYDVHYQNEQSNSEVFKNHLSGVLQLLHSFGIHGKKIVEVGCGKGVFFEMMLKENLDCWGFDPTYEGTNSRIIKEYFDESKKDIGADVIIMRHTLEHITSPFSFLHTIAKANDYKGYLFVEVPTFDWIINKKAFWDIFYEHCNYFTEQSLGCMFDDAVTGNFFGGQYIYLWADLGKIRSEIPAGIEYTKFDTSVFSEKLEGYEKMLNDGGSFAVWGAGAKGSTFLNLLDAQKNRVRYAIDINPMKQGKYIAGTGHAVYAPDILLQEPVNNILIMNENYIGEIKEYLSNHNITATVLSL